LASFGSRTPKTISCPAEAHPPPKAFPTLPAPMMAILMVVVLHVVTRHDLSLRLLLACHPL
jgi:hypothetical protein